MKKELFILGAGSSFPYGMPLGSDLIEWIKSFELLISYYKIGLTTKNLNERSYKDIPYFDSREYFDLFSDDLKESISRDIKTNPEMRNPYEEPESRTMEAYGTLDFPDHINLVAQTYYPFLKICTEDMELFTVDLLERFLKDLRLSSSATIDTFLSGNNHQNQVIGQLLIGYFIYIFQNGLKQESKNEDWIKYFINQRIHFRQYEFISDPPVFISFNYDQIFKIKVEQAIKPQFNINVFHVYGNIPVTEFPDDDFTQVITKNLIQRLIEEGVETINRANGIISDIRLSELTNKIRKNIAEADKIYILGYGFDKYNNQLLFDNERNLMQLIKDKEIYSTGYLKRPLIGKINSLVVDDELVEKKYKKQQSMFVPVQRIDPRSNIDILWNQKKESEEKKKFKSDPDNQEYLQVIIPDTNNLELLSDYALTPDLFPSDQLI